MNLHTMFLETWTKYGRAAALAFVRRMESVKPLHHYSTSELAEYRAAKIVAGLPA